MKFKNRLIRNKEGGLEIRLSFSFTKSEVDNLDKIPDDPNVSFQTLREKIEDPYQKVEWYFTWLRLICFWTDIGNNKEKNSDLIINSRLIRKYKMSRNNRRRKR